MLTVEVPGERTYDLARIVLDVNGTIAEDGHLIPGVKDLLTRLGRTLDVVMVTADTHGRQAAIDSELELQATRLERGRSESEQKAELMRRLGAEQSVAIGNGANDALMLKEAAIGIAVLGPEGTSVAALGNADVVARTIVEALELLLHPRRLVATLRH